MPYALDPAPLANSSESLAGSFWRVDAALRRARFLLYLLYLCYICNFTYILYVTRFWRVDAAVRRARYFLYFTLLYLLYCGAAASSGRKSGA